MNTGGKEYYGGSKKFTGANESLKGKVFDVTSREAVHQFADTLKAIADYVGQQYTHGGDVRFMIENLTDYTFVRPPNPQNAATNHIFRTRMDEEKLSKSHAMIYHSTVAKLLFVAKRARPDILLAVSFMTTRVKNPDMDDWHKLVRVLSYLKGILDISLTLI